MVFHVLLSKIKRLAEGAVGSANAEVGQQQDRWFVERVGKEGWAVASDEGLTVAVDIAVDDELRRERRVLDLIHQVNAMRREAGLELTDRIRLWVPDEELLAYEERIKEDTLALSVEPGELRLEKA